MSWTEFLREVDRRGGVADASLARSVDLPSTTYQRWVQGWEAPFPGVRLAPWCDPSDPRVQAAAALRSVGGDVALARWTAAFVLGLSAPSPRIHLTLPRNRRRRSSRSLLAAPLSRYRRGDLVQVDGFPVTPAAWTLAELTSRVGQERLLGLAIEARFRGLLPDGALDHELELWPKLAGRARLRAVAEMLRSDHSQSGFEHRAVDRLVIAGIRRPDQQVPVVTPARRYHLDLGWRPEQVGIECVGLAYHRDRPALERDADRANDVAELGDWIVLQLTWMTFTRDWERFLDRVRRVLTRRRSERGLPLT